MFIMSNDVLLEKFKEMPEIDYPAALHGRIMAAVVLLRFKKIFGPVFLILVANLFIVGSFFLIRFVEDDALSFVSFIVREFEASGGYFFQLLSVIRSDVPLNWLLVFGVNLALIIYFVRKYLSLKENVNLVFLEQNI